MSSVSNTAQKFHSGDKVVYSYAENWGVGTVVGDIFWDGCQRFFVHFEGVGVKECVAEILRHASE